MGEFLRELAGVGGGVRELMTDGGGSLTCEDSRGRWRTWV